MDLLCFCVLCLKISLTNLKSINNYLHVWKFLHAFLLSAYFLQNKLFKKLFQTIGIMDFIVEL